MRRTVRDPDGPRARAAPVAESMEFSRERQQQARSGLRRWGRALLLQGLWRFRWYHAVAAWAFLSVQAWYASPYLLVHTIGMPAPGTFQRHAGTIRVEGELRRGRGRSIPPRYFIRTAQGEVEFHCGYRPSPWECWFGTLPAVPPAADDQYEIGYDPYWGIDFVRHPARLSFLDEESAPHEIVAWRRLHLRHHDREAALLAAGLIAYMTLVLLAFRKDGGRRAAPPPGLHRPT